jgi:gamma-carbonic anhydrase
MPLYRLGDLTPAIAADAFIAPDAQIIGDVRIGAGASVWFGCVLRGDVNFIRVGQGSNIQDGTIVHVTRKRHGTVIGDHVLVGHQCMIHGCELQDHSFIGLGATVMDACVVETDGMLAAGALLTPGKVVKSGQLWAGSPARYVRELTPDEIARNRAGAAGYVELARQYRAELVAV